MRVHRMLANLAWERISLQLPEVDNMLNARDGFVCLIHSSLEGKFTPVP